MLLTLISIVLLFATLALTPKFLTTTLHLLAIQLRLSPRATGMILLSLGNALPDILTTISAFAHGSEGLAMGEVLGVVNLGMLWLCLIGFTTVHDEEVGEDAAEERRVDKTLLIDLIGFGTLVVLCLLFISDGKLWDWECGLLIIGYGIYVWFAITEDDEDIIAEGETVCEQLPHTSADHVSIASTISRSGSRSRSRNSQEVVDAILDVQSLQVSDLYHIYRDPEQTRSFNGFLDVERPEITRGRSLETMMDQQQAPHRNIDKVFAPRPLHTSSLVSTVPHIFVTDTTTDTEETTINEANETSHFNSNESTTLIRSQLSSRSSYRPLPHLQSQSFGKDLFDYLKPQSRFQLLLLPLLILLKFIIPYPSIETLHSRLLPVQTITTPLILHAVSGTLDIVIVYLIALFALASTLLLAPETPYTLHPLHPILSLLTLLPLSAILTSFLVKALLVLSTALNIPQSIIGLTILTLGNSIGDVVSIIGLGILGMTDVGIGACLGAPVGVVGLGVGLGGAGVLLHTRLTFSAEKLSEMGQTGVRYIAVAIDAHFVISCVQLVVMLGFLIGWFALGGKLDWRVGIWGILCWSGGMIVHLGSELVA